MACGLWWWCSWSRGRWLWPLGLALITSSVQALPGGPTDDAFAALLSLPGAGPENGRWNTPIPADFAGRTEAQLQVYLARKQTAGADVNAVRHQGTLLHHAIRAGQSGTALWLLAHGADPKRQVQGSGEDALALSLRYRLTRVTLTLQKQFGMRPAALAATEPAPLQGEAALRETLRQASWARPDDAPGPPQRQQRERDALQRWAAAQARLSPAALARLLDRDASLTDWVRLHSHRPEALAQALAALPPALLKQRATAALAGLADGARRLAGDATGYTPPAASWRALWQALPAPLHYRRWPQLAQALPVALWPELFASGYANHLPESALGCLVADTGAADMAALWPQWTALFPELRQVAPRMVLSDHRLWTPTRGGCSGRDTLEKLRFLTAQGLAVPVPGLRPSLWRSASAEMQRALEPYVQAAPTPSAQPRITEVKPQCHFELNALWYGELLQRPVVGLAGERSEQVHVDTVQLLEIPGDAECALLVGGFSRVQPYLGGLTDNFTGPTSDPIPSCPDPTDRYEVWRVQDGAILRRPADMGADWGVPRLIPVRDRVGGQRYLMHTGLQQGRCTGGRARLPFLLAWQPDAAGGALNLSTSLALEEVLFAECERQAETDMPLCSGVPSLGQPGKDLGLPAFLRTFRRAQRRAYLAAVMALNRPALDTLMVEGVPGDWTAQAIAAVGAARLPLSGKRQRAALLFSDAAQLARALPLIDMRALVAWLPREDWAPLLSGMAESMDPGQQALGRAKQAAEARGQHQLVCDLDQAQGLVCGESLSP